MLGLFGSLDLSARAVQAQRQGLDVAGQNLANVNTAGYTRQRLMLQSLSQTGSGMGWQGAGVTAAGVQQIRSTLLDRQVQSETSVGGFWTAQQQTLEQAQASLGELLDNQSSSATSTTSTTSTDGSSLGKDITALFNAFGALTSPSSSSADSRAALLAAAQGMASKFRQTDQRMSELQGSLNESVTTETAQANQLMDDLARLNQQILRAEGGGATANELRDTRQTKLEDLAKLVNVETAADSDGQLSVSVSGQLLVSGSKVMDRLQTYDAGGGMLQLRAETAGTAVPLTGGSIQGTIDARDGAIGDLRKNLDSLASSLITQVNAAHSDGFNLAGGSGRAFFTGTGAADIGVNSALKSDPSLIQLSGDPAASGNTSVALILAGLGTAKQAALGGQTFIEDYNATVAGLGQALAGANTQVADQKVVQDMLQRQRDSISGVSVDEEMTDIVKYQKAFEASARMLSTLNELLGEVINLGR